MGLADDLRATPFHGQAAQLSTRLVHPLVGTASSTTRPLRDNENGLRVLSVSELEWAAKECSAIHGIDTLDPSRNSFVTSMPATLYWMVNILTFP